ncbi:recQ-mediated genome instability protein 1 [Cornus florida]|uniref:recQ-mediated genome instability protein 1 n=1 Tax=Cornus florida TaxID=4283 RepID=UPI00289C85F1|nr:recQ-mediated genome instability protein 1 [Cornus florida]
MPRRRLRVVCSSDEEEEEDEQRSQQRNQEIEDNISDYDIEVELQDPTLNLESVALNSSSNPNPNPSEPVPFEISDEDFMDVPDNLSPPPPPPSTAEQSFQSSSGSRTSGTNFSESSDCPISDVLRMLGLRLRREWLDSCIRGLESSVPGLANFDVEVKAKLCFEQFLCSDMNYSGGGGLPENVHSMHLVDLTGPFVLQVDEIINLSCPLKERYQSAPSGVKRCLKLSMTDGVQRVFGMEYRPIKDLEVLAPAGLKVAICNANIRHGILMLVPEVFEVLGGLVEELDAARQRLVNEINKPPRGKRTRTGVVPPLATRATLAAWPQNCVSSPGHNNNSTSQAAIPMQEDEQVRTASVISTSERNTEESAVPISRENAEQNLSSTTFMDVEEIHMVDEEEHPFILSGDRETPFTYLASLSAKWAAMQDTASNVQGIIKCFLTGVKKFQYKQRTTFELRVYVDDGSLISEILIDHNVVQRGIGHSPEEVTGALTSSDSKRVSDMKETMKQFQIFLVNFEGTMLVQMNKASPIPIAIEMNQGSSASDAWLLLRRLRASNSDQPPPPRHLNPINISP